MSLLIQDILQAVELYMPWTRTILRVYKQMMEICKPWTGTIILIPLHGMDRQANKGKRLNIFFYFASHIKLEDAVVHLLCVDIRHEVASFLSRFTAFYKRSQAFFLRHILLLFIICSSVRSTGLRFEVLEHSYTP